MRFKCPYCETDHPIDFDVNSNCIHCGKPARHFEVHYPADANTASRMERWLQTFQDNAMRGCPLGEPLQIAEQDLPVVTPLRRAERLGASLGLRRLYLKDETRHPIGAFKERLGCVAINHVLQSNPAPVLMASSGNMCAAFARYGMLYHVPVIIAVPEDTPNEKIANSLAYGSSVVKVKGTVDGIRTMLDGIARRRGWYMANYALRPWLTEGGKSLAYELMRQLPEMHYIFVPTGSGLLVRSIIKAYHEVRTLKSGKFPVPRVIISQAAGCAPYVRAVLRDEPDIEPWADVQTCAGGLATRQPPEGQIVLKRIREVHGGAESVTDEELLDAQTLLARSEGIFVEPSGAAGVAVVRKMVRQNTIDPDSVIVAVLTGAGWHDTRSIPVDKVPVCSTEEEVDNVLSHSSRLSKGDKG